MSRAKKKSAGLQFDMDAAVYAIESLLSYNFRNRSLLEEALTHPSFIESPSFERLEFVGDSALGCAFSQFLFMEYRYLNPGQLSRVKAVNICTEKLARVAVRQGLYMYIRHSAPLVGKVKQFVDTVREENGMAIHGGSKRPPKILADVVEALAAAVYVDCGFDLKHLWRVFKPLLEPIVTPEDLRRQPQPVSKLFQTCQKQGKLVEIRHWRRESMEVATVFIDGCIVASNASEQRDYAKLAAAKEALKKLSQTTISIHDKANILHELDRAKPTLFELCAKKKWPKPEFKVETEEGPPRDRKFRYWVTIKASDSLISMKGDSRSKINDAKSSASLFMLHYLHDTGLISP